jgi:hypothetical protein
MMRDLSFKREMIRPSDPSLLELENTMLLEVLVQAVGLRFVAIWEAHSVMELPIPSPGSIIRSKR